MMPRRLLLVVSGSLSAAFVPYWANWLRVHQPAIEVRSVLTRSALGFVTPTAVAAATGGAVLEDHWEARGAGNTLDPVHVELAEWADAVLVYPASFHYVARLAQGLADTPSLLALHLTRAPVLVAPSVPPGSLDSEVFQSHLASLRARTGYQVAPMVLAHSVSGSSAHALVPPPLPDLLQSLVDASDAGPPVVDREAVR